MKISQDLPEASIVTWNRKSLQEIKHGENSCSPDIFIETKAKNLARLSENFDPMKMGSDLPQNDLGQAVSKERPSEGCLTCRRFGLCTINAQLVL